MSVAIQITQPLVASKAIFAYNLTLLMKDKGIAPAVLARDMGITPYRVDRWLREICYPTNDCLVVLCNYFSYYNIYDLLTKKIDET